MEVQLNLFDEKLDVLDKSRLKDCIQHTRLLGANPSFTLTRWAAGDERLVMHYQIKRTIIGELLIAATAKGITYLGFVNTDRKIPIADLQKRFPENILTEENTELLNIATDRINHHEKMELPLPLHLKGTEFQIAIWKRLLLIPFGGLTNYKQLGNGEPDSRIIGAAVGANPVSYLIPCHRVVHADGNFSGFFWGNKVKSRLLTYEQTFESVA